MSFHSYMVVFCAPIQRDRELPILDPIARVIAFKLHGEGIRDSQTLSIALQGLAPDESFLYVLLDMWNMFGQKFLSFIGG